MNKFRPIRVTTEKMSIRVKVKLFYFIKLLLKIKNTLNVKVNEKTF
jgi:hypothetical protein